MIFETTASPRNLFCELVKRFHFYCLVLGLLVLPTSSFAAYFSGPPEILAALQFNSQGEVVFGSEDYSQDHLIPIDPSSGELIPSELNVSKEENLYGEAEPGGSEVDPYSDEALEEDDPFGDAELESALHVFSHENVFHHYDRRGVANDQRGYLFIDLSNPEC